MSRLSQMIVNEQKRLGLTDREVCEPRGWLQQSFSSWKNGTVPRAPIHKELANFLMISPDMLDELVEEARTSTGNTKIPLSAKVRQYGKVTDRKTGKFKFEPFNNDRKTIPEGRYYITVDTKVMEPALLVGTKAWLDPAVWPHVGHEVIVHAKGGNAWLGRLVSLDDGRAEIENAAGPMTITDVQAVHVVVLSERI